MRKFDSLLDLMREATLVAIPPRGGAVARGSLWAQLELSLPGGMKDRPALAIVEEAEAAGLIKPGDVLVESSSGTMAEGLARVGALKGYRVIIVTDPRIDALTEVKLRALGAELEIVQTYDPQGGWQSSRLRRLREVLESHTGAFWSRQYDNPTNAGAYRHLGRELVDVLGSGIAALVGSVGSGGSLTGLGRALKELVPAARIVAVDAVGSVLFNQPDRRRLQSGHGNSIVPGNLFYPVIDQVHWVADGEAFTACRELARRTGLFAGGSSGAVYIAASWWAQQAGAGQHVVALLPDRGDRYHGTVYSDKFLAEQGLTLAPAGSEPVAIRYGVDVAERWSFAELPHDGSVCHHHPQAQQTSDLARSLGLDP